MDKIPKPKVCRYCGNKVVLTSNSEIYGKEYGNGRCYLCRNCKAFVGVHTGTTIPLGTLADAYLRELRKTAHYWFDQIWRNYKNCSRDRAYRWLSRELEIPHELTHIGMFEEPECRETIRLAQERLAKRKQKVGENV